MAFCAKCGNEIKEGEAFCGNCGAPAPVNNTQQATNQPNPNQYNQPQNNPNQYGQPQYNQQQYGQPQYSQPAIAQKNRVAAGLLAIFFGVFAIYDFYLGKKTKAIVHLILGLGGIVLMIYTVSQMLPYSVRDYSATGYSYHVVMSAVPPYLLTFFSIGLFSMIGAAIWGFIEGIMILVSRDFRDGYGRPLI